MMTVPSAAEAESLLNEAEALNPGPWVAHSRVAGQCAKTIAERCPDMDADAAYVMGLLHDIGRRAGVYDMRHVLDGHRFMMEKGYDGCARICLTHSFAYQDIRAFTGENDQTAVETSFLRALLEATTYNDYDRLIQLCDALAYPTGPCVVEKRLIDVSIRRGVNELTVEKWKAHLANRDYFCEKIGMSIYDLFDDLVL